MGTNPQPWKHTKTFIGNFIYLSTHYRGILRIHIYKAGVSCGVKMTDLNDNKHGFEMKLTSSHSGIFFITDYFQ